MCQISEVTVIKGIVQYPNYFDNVQKKRFHKSHKRELNKMIWDEKYKERRPVIRFNACLYENGIYHYTNSQKFKLKELQKKWQDDHKSTKKVS